MHGLFSADGFRQAYLDDIGAETSDISFEDQIEKTLDALADHIEEYTDVGFIWDLADEIVTP